MPDLTGVRVLVVEDEGMVAFLLEEMLEELGWRVVASVPSVARALEAIRSIAIEVVLLDVNLGGETSFGVARELARRQIPFVFSTGYGKGGLPPDLQDRPVLTKPFALSDLRQTIESVLSLRGLTVTQSSRVTRQNDMGGRFGYTGGILSAAVDGIDKVEAVALSMLP